MTPWALSGPSRLRAAVDELPPARDPVQPPKGALEGLRRQLLGLSPEDLGRFRMRRRAQEALPLLLAGRPDPELRARALALARRELDSLSWSALGRLYVELYTDPGLRVAVRERLARDPPARGPAWLTRFGAAATAPQDPVRALAHAALGAGIVLCQLHPLLGLRTDSALGIDTLIFAIEHISDSDLNDQPYTDTLQWIAHSGASPTARRALLARVCALSLRPCPPPAAWATPGPLRELLEAARALCGGWPDARPGAWARMPAALRQVADAQPRVRGDTLGAP